MHGHKILAIAAAHPTQQETLSAALAVSPIVAQVLINRGLSDPEAAARFLDTSLAHLRDPFDFKDMRAAVARLAKARANNERVLVYGDYDVDGITSCALLTTVFAREGIAVDHYLPHRIREGYGLTPEIARIAAERNISLVVTADCGISAHAQIAELNAAGIEVIITDHHEPPQGALPAAYACINPKVPGCGYGFRELAGVGVAFKLCQALTGASLEDELDLVGMGTIADVVPLVDENRIFARQGVWRLARTQRPGIRALLESSRMTAKPITATTVSYILGPRINASGRMDSADQALALLTTQDIETARALALEIEQCNRQRQKTESRIMDEAVALIEQEINFRDHRVIVVAKDDWHQGVLGVVASKLADRYYRPTILISMGDTHGKGSGRSIPRFHLHQALRDCEEALDSFGGHSHAVGLVIARDNIAAFRQRLNALAHERLRIEDLMPSIEVDVEVLLSAINSRIAEEFARLEPFGAGNPEPALLSRKLTVKGVPQVLSRDTIKFWVTDGANTLPVIGFGMGGMKESLSRAGVCDLVYTPRIDSWVSDTAVILEAKEVVLR
jgi:single-stranded-DNA-specific exonuclease